MHKQSLGHTILISSSSDNHRRNMVTSELLDAGHFFLKANDTFFGLKKYARD